jgi:YfiH family protein
LKKKTKSIYWGNAHDRFFKDEYTNEAFERLRQVCSPDYLILLNQTHGTQGHIITADNVTNFTPLCHEGDYIMTDLHGIALGIMTADCVPVIGYDPLHHVAIALHVGWRGAFAGIIPKAFGHLFTHFGSKQQDMQLFLGPCAQVCCYQVSHDFAQNLIKRDGNYFFDVPLFVTQQLIALGIPPTAIDQAQSRCTICDTRFFSHRRQGDDAGRNISAICLKE